MTGDTCLARGFQPPLYPFALVETLTTGRYGVYGTWRNLKEQLTATRKAQCITYGQRCQDILVTSSSLGAEAERTDQGTDRQDDLACLYQSSGRNAGASSLLRVFYSKWIGYYCRTASRIQEQCTRKVIVTAISSMYMGHYARAGAVRQ